MENGPCRMVNSTATEPHPESWNSHANIFFVDQPVGVGFSYADYGEHVDTTEDAAQDIVAFVALFFENFPSFKSRSFHMAGESYAGRYVPLFAAAVYDQNTALLEAGLTPINLTSAVIGNGLTERGTMFSSYYDMACTPASLPPVLGISTCVRMKQAVPRCLKWHKESCVDYFDSMSCRAATDFCSSELEAPYEDFGLNVFDISKPCEGLRRETFCYYIVTDIISYLSQPSTRNILGVDPAAQNFSVVSWPVNYAFDAADDVLHDSHEHVAALLERGMRVLIYVGTYDWGCNWVGNERWTLELEWSGREAFVDAEFREWDAGGKVAGKVPYDKPVEALALINRWLDNVPL
ncbi:hypothetical protein EWM64_g9472 [Hericium alpestre]|uniref:Carboxypeptidase n=1 Tax=Hericium alpestre TaxID=135208 RepID=A0A4Y9ZL46_9AGAM|nr:hypothetical protein EWM64_g9472 [Hericium alpestre]